MIQAFKLINGFHIVAPNVFFSIPTTDSRVTHLSYMKMPLCTFSFSNMIIEEWNSLPQLVVSSANVNTFKNRFDHHCLQYRVFTEVLQVFFPL